jgi:glycosyltransferase involved in cell wall biosynthesis
VRVALVPSAYAPAVGGVEQLTATLARQLVTGGDDVEVWTTRHPADLPADEHLEGVRVRRFAFPMPRQSVPALLRLAKEVPRARESFRVAADEFRPDVLHVQCFSASGVYAARLARLRRLPLVVSLQGETVMDDADIYDRSVALRYLLRRALRDAAAVTACSHFVLRDAERRFALLPGKGSVIPNGVELRSVGAVEPLSLPFDRFVLGLGRLVTKKGFDLLLAAFGEIAPRHPSVGLVIGGDGPAREALIRAGQHAGLAGRVVFPGVLSRSQVAWAMSSAAVFVLPSRVEPFGIVVVEALRAGCPAIVSTRGGATEVVRPGVDGLAVDPFDTPRFAEAIDCLLADGDAARRFASAGRARAAVFDLAAVTDRYRSVYDRLRLGSRRT